MEKKELLNFLDGILIPNGFKRKGNNWVINGEKVCKIINLQKSQYGNVYYLNYDYVVTSLPLNGWKTHVNHRLGSKEKEVQNRITELLNLENDIESIDRFSELGDLLMKKLYLKCNLFLQKKIF